MKTAFKPDDEKYFTHSLQVCSGRVPRAARPRRDKEAVRIVQNGLPRLRVLPREVQIRGGLTDQTIEVKRDDVTSLLLMEYLAVFISPFTDTIMLIRVIY